MTLSSDYIVTVCNYIVTVCDYMVYLVKTVLILGIGLPRITLLVLTFPTQDSAIKEYRNSILTTTTGYRLMQTLVDWRLSYVGHVLRSDTLERKPLMGVVFGAKRRGRPRTRFIDNLEKECGLTQVKVLRAAQDQEKWRAMTRRATVVHL